MADKRPGAVLPIPDRDYQGPVQFDAKSGGGLRYSRFHTTALCSPTRPALLTRRNHHAVGMGHITETAMPAPSYRSIRPRDSFDTTRATF
jgi:arylsulfatase A-like enzyme